MAHYLQYVLLGIMLAAPIGQASLAVIQNGLRGGFWRAWRTGVGVTLADASMLLVVYFGLAGVMDVTWVKTAVWSLGALVLLYLGTQSLRAAASSWREGRLTAGKLGNGKTSQSGEAASSGLMEKNPFVTGYLVNISNPVAVVFWAGIYGSLVSAAGEATTGDAATGDARAKALLSGAAILTGILIWHTTTSILTHWGRRLLNPRLTALISAAAGLVLILFGLRFAWSALETALK